MAKFYQLHLAQRQLLHRLNNLKTDPYAHLVHMYVLGRSLILLIPYNEDIARDKHTALGPQRMTGMHVDKQ